MDWHYFLVALNSLEWKHAITTQEETGFKVLKVKIPSENKSGDWILTLTQSPTPIAFIPGEEEDEEKGPQGYRALDFIIPLTSKVAKEQEGDVMQLLTFINANLPLAGFYFNIIDGKLFFRYLWFFHAAFLEETILIYLLETIQDILDNYGFPIKELAAGRVSFEAVIERWVQDFKSLTEKTVSEGPPDDASAIP